MIPVSQIRAKARQTLGDSLFGGGWLYAVLVVVLISAISSALAATGFGTFIFAGLIALAGAAYFRARVRKTIDPANLNVLIDGVKTDIGGGIILGILETVFIALWTLLFIIPGIVKSLSYSMAYYIKLDRPELTATECITESRRMMDGFKMKYFVLHLSFLGWYLLGILCLGVGVIWADAYAKTADAIFYEELKAIKCPVLDTPLYEQVMNTAPAEE